MDIRTAGYSTRLGSQINKSLLLSVLGACLASVAMGVLIHSMMWKAYRQGSARLPNHKVEMGSPETKSDVRPRSPMRKNDRHRTLNA